MNPRLNSKNKIFSWAAVDVMNRHLVWGVVLKTVTSGFLMGLVVLVWGYQEWALGIFLGCLIAAINFVGLNTLTQRILKRGGSKGHHFFWIWNMARWVGLIGICELLHLISIQCLWGGLAGYLWFLIIFTWTSWRRTASKTQPMANGF